jgi:hypothetical protein
LNNDEPCAIEILEKTVIIAAKEGGSCTAMADIEYWNPQPVLENCRKGALTKPTEGLRRPETYEVLVRLEPLRPRAPDP